MTKGRKPLYTQEQVKAIRMMLKTHTEAEVLETYPMGKSTLLKIRNAQPPYDYKETGQSEFSQTTNHVQ